MFNWLTDITSIFIVLPIAVFTVVACFITYIFKRPRYAFKIACDFSTIFLILAVHLFMKLLFGKSFLLYILLFLFLIGIALIFMFAKRDGEIHIKKNDTRLLAHLFLCVQFTLYHPFPNRSYYGNCSSDRIEGPKFYVNYNNHTSYPQDHEFGDPCGAFYSYRPHKIEKKFSVSHVSSDMRLFFAVKISLAKTDFFHKISDSEKYSFT